MNLKNFKISYFEFIDGYTPSFSIVHNTSKANIEKDLSRWYRQTFEYTQSSFLDYLDLNAGYRAFKLKD